MEETQAFLMCIGVRTATVLVPLYHRQESTSKAHAEIWTRCHRQAVFAAAHGLEAVHQGNGELSQFALPC